MNALLNTPYRNRLARPAHLVISCGLAIFTGIALVGCGPKLSGKYAGSSYGVEVMSAEFKGGDEVYVSTMAGTTKGKFSVDDDHVTIEANGQNMVLTIAKDGSLTGGPMGVTLKKKD